MERVIVLNVLVLNVTAVQDQCHFRKLTKLTPVVMTAKSMVNGKKASILELTEIWELSMQ